MVEAALLALALLDADRRRACVGSAWPKQRRRPEFRSSSKPIVRSSLTATSDGAHHSGSDPSQAHAGLRPTAEGPGMVAGLRAGTPRRVARGAPLLNYGSV